MLIWFKCVIFEPKFQILKDLLNRSIQSQKVFYRYFRRKGWKRFLKENILEVDGSNRTKAISVALGIFIGLTPFYGFHAIIGVFLATVFKLNKVITFAFTRISFPLFLPFIIMTAMFIGDFFVEGETDFRNTVFDKNSIKANLIQYIIGQSILTVAAPFIFGSLTYLFLEKVSPKKSAT